MSAMDYREPNQARWVGVRPAHKGTQVIKSSAVSNGVSIIHTVTASKVFFMTGFSFGADASAAGHQAQLFIRDSGDNLIAYLYTIRFRSISHLVNSTPLYYPIEIPALYDVVVLSTDVSTLVRGSVWGWEE